ncbi:hypothetical protein V8C42DRAFT_356139 [Trichoderma barbatum]
MARTATNNCHQRRHIEGIVRRHNHILVHKIGCSVKRVAKVGGDDANTFATYNKPVSNIVLVQKFDADTKERVFAVALVDDEQAEEYYRKYGDKDEPSDQSSGDAMQPQQFLFERVPAA